ncbi:growth/differentiation factor 2-like [Prorops nasuta]|uniref:growth/differentiation factor 2-like n=1 Tax=Prorops nasuta TaxID=863751 RepID=UPI0034CF7165
MMQASHPYWRLFQESFFSASQPHSGRTPQFQIEIRVQRLIFNPVDSVKIFPECKIVISRMSLTSQFLILIGGAFGVCCFLKFASLSWPVSSVRAKASIQLDLNLPSSRIVVSHRLFNSSTKKPFLENRKRHSGVISRYMLQLYHRRPEADIIRAVEPDHVSGPVSGGGRIVEFSIPSIDPEETLESGELLGPAGSILRVRSVDAAVGEKLRDESRRENSWRAFNLTSVLASRGSDRIRLHVIGIFNDRSRGERPILLLSYSKSRKKRRLERSVVEEDSEDGGRWEEEGPRRRRRNGCRRRPLYVDFSLISYDDWVVAPPGYEAYQCAGKCFYPFADHLSPTKHAIVQTLVHSALQSRDPFGGNKPVSRACCVPTKLAPTSLLYLDSSGTLTYQYGYEDMVVVECGCR